MKNNYLNFFAIVVSLSISACTNSQETEKTKEKIDHAAEKVETAVENAVDKVKEKIDENFVSNVFEDNAKEIEWLRAGSKMGTDAELISIAKKMIPDHEKLASDLKAYAAKHDIKLDKEAKNVKVDSKTGTEWDEEWADKIRDMQRDMVDKFERVQSNAEEIDLKDLATATLPVLRSHLNMTEKLETRLDKITK